MDIAQLLVLATRLGASDVHLASLCPPTVRLRGDILPIPEAPVLSPEAVHRLIYDVLTDQQKARFEESMSLDLALELSGIGRYRANVFQDRNGPAASFRLIPERIRGVDELGLPEVLKEFARYEDGLVLVTGPTGCGKSTSLAAMVDQINTEFRKRIITIEEPIEFIHKHKSCVVHQREIGPHATSFSDALRAALREDPDVILIGEMRDLETISLAITAAETGHLVLGTIHTPGAPQTIDRIIDVFPLSQQEQIRSQLSDSVRAIASQILLPRATGEGRVAAVEVMVATPAIRNLIRESKTYQMLSIMQTSGAAGMMTMDQHLAELVMSGYIARETAARHVRNPDTLSGVAGGFLLQSGDTRQSLADTMVDMRRGGQQQKPGGGR